MLTLLNTIVNYSYYLLSIFVAFILIREIIKTDDLQESILYCIILIPFVLRSLHIK
jgi:uncharacterized protein YqhQ